MKDPHISHSSIFDPAVLARLENLALRAGAIFGSQTVGQHTSKMYGFSAEFAQHRPWEEGDDPKFLDWRVFARTGKRFLKRFTEDKNQTYYFLLDNSRSMKRTGILPGQKKDALMKNEYAACLGAILGYLAISQKDRFGVSVQTDQAVIQKEPGTGEPHYFECLDLMEHSSENTEKKSEVNFKTFLQKTFSSFTRRGVIFIASDFFDVESFTEILPVLRLLRSERYDTAVFHILAPDEISFPYTSTTEFVSLENPQKKFNTASGEMLQKAYLECFSRWQSEIKEGCENLGIFYLLTPTNIPLDQPLREFLRRF
ncbi:MAG: DUF58 domain-containing protein [Planctomycetia bacterium]|nr:DUF58 domain-containing protein [Planctomycetia bacterium]